MAKDSINRIEQSKPLLSNFEDFNNKIKKEIAKVEVRKMVKKNPKNLNLLDFVGFIDTKEETNCMKDHDIIQ